MSYSSQHRIQRPSGHDAYKVANSFKVRFNSSINSWEVWTFMAPRIDNYKWFQIDRATVNWYQREFNAPIVEYVQEHNFPPIRKHGDYLLSALESELTISPRDSSELQLKKVILKNYVTAYMAMPEGMTAEDAAAMEAIDQAVIAVREQRMADSLNKHG